MAGTGPLFLLSTQRRTAANTFLILADAVQGVFAPIEAVAMTTEEWERGDSLIAAFARRGEVLYAA